MEKLDEVIIYVNQEIYGKKNLLLTQNLEELRFELEKEIPNQIYFLKEGKTLEKESEKSLIIQNILNESNSIYLLQEFFHVFVDDKESKIKVNIFKKDSFQKFMQFYIKEFPNYFMIKCDSNLLIEFNNTSIDDSILIEDILIGNSIFVFSFKKKKEISKIVCNKDSLGLLVKKNTNIIFGNIQFQKIRILDSLILDGEFVNSVNESNYEKRRRISLEEYEKYKKGPPNEDKIEKIISYNNTNENAVFDYLLLLKKNNNSKFQEELKKYAYLLSIDKLKQLDNKFNDQKFKEYKDEKSNLINFLKKVINGHYEEYDDVGLIINDIDYRDNIQKDIISPFIGSFNKDININIPISISDNNLFFHYIRVKFFQCLQNSFGNFKKKFVHFCEILSNKIKALTDKKTSDIQKKLLMEIFCMICIFGLHDKEKTEVIDYYNYNQEVSEEYYHPIIFFCRVKNILFDYFRMIGNSNCLNTALLKYKNIINENAKNYVESDIKNSIYYLIRNTVFLPFFSKHNWGLIIPAFNLSFINIDIFDFQENNNSYPDYVFLFYFIKYIISFLHEPIGFNFQINESFNEKMEIPFDTPRINDKTYKQGGYLMEFLLINSVENLNIEHVLFLLNENNWTLDHTIFLEKFKAIKLPILENCINFINTGKMLKKLFNFFKINQKSIEDAIKNSIQLPTQLNERFNNGLIILSIDEKYMKKKGDIKEKKGRICLTHLYY